MDKGDLALVLHAHLPYVRSERIGSLEEDWFFQALLECYLPLVQLLEKSARDLEQNPRLTLSLSPTLLSLLNEKELTKRFPDWIKIRLNLVEKSSLKGAPVDHLVNFFESQLGFWNAC